MNIKEDGEPWIYLGWNARSADVPTGTGNRAEKGKPAVRPPDDIPAEGVQTQAMRFKENACILSVFMITNLGNVMEDLEEIYETRIRMKTRFSANMGSIADMSSIFMADYPRFPINMRHNPTTQTLCPMLDNNTNLWVMNYDVTLSGPALEFNESQIAAAKSISAELYGMSRGFVTEEHTT
jgi:hypothetical protein